MDLGLANRVCVALASSGGLGRAVAAALLAEGEAGVPVRRLGDPMGFGAVVASLLLRALQLPQPSHPAGGRWAEPLVPLIRRTRTSRTRSPSWRSTRTT